MKSVVAKLWHYILKRRRLTGEFVGFRGVYGAYT
jgi:hypothetical protein